MHAVSGETTMQRAWFQKEPEVHIRSISPVLFEVGMPNSCVNASWDHGVSRTQPLPLPFDLEKSRHEHKTFYLT